MGEERMEIKIGLFITGAFILGALAVGINAVPEISRKLNLDITQQQHIYSYDTEVYLEDKKLEPCEDESKIVCKFACAPEGLCIFIPAKITKDFSF